MRKFVTFIALLSTLLLTLPQVGSAETFSFHGIALEMSLAQVKAALPSSFKIDNVPVKFDDPALQAYIAHTKPLDNRNTGLIDLGSAYLLFFCENRLVYMQYGEAFPPGNRPQIEQIASAMKAKYGTPSFDTGSGQNWTFTGDGRFLPNVTYDQQEALEHPGSNCAVHAAFEFSYVGIIRFSVPTLWDRYCGRHIEVAEQRDPDNQVLAASYLVRIFDQAHVGKRLAADDANKQKALNDQAARAPKITPP